MRHRHGLEPLGGRVDARDGFREPREMMPELHPLDVRIPVPHLTRSCRAAQERGEEKVVQDDAITIPGIEGRWRGVFRLHGSALGQEDGTVLRDGPQRGHGVGREHIDRAVTDAP